MTDISTYQKRYGSSDMGCCYWLHIYYCLLFISYRNRVLIISKNLSSYDQLKESHTMQKCKARKVNCGCVYSVYILKPVLSGRNL